MSDLLPLSSTHPLARFVCGDFSVTYVLDPKNHLVGLRLLPLAKEAEVVAHRQTLETLEIQALPASWKPFPAYQGEISLIQLKLAEDDSGGGFGAGRSMRVNPTVEGLRLVEQIVDSRPEGFTIQTVLQGARAFRCTHFLRYEQGDEAVTVWTEFQNTGNTELTLEMLSSFCLGYLSPFDAEDSSERLNVHRFRSTWSGEGRHESTLLEDLHLERSWASHSVVSERFGQVGSMPVRNFFPFAAIEDQPTGVFWGAQLALPGSWQIEVYRRDDKVSLSGGLADREFGHWLKQIAPGETFAAPRAFLSTAIGDIDSFTQRLTRMQTRPLASVPAIENAMPILFNEWCSSWGLPTPEFIHATTERLRETPTKIFVIDDGWAEKPPGTLQFNGDWNVELTRFPKGLKPITDDLRARGFIPGLWFEMEVCTDGTKAFAMPDHKLRRDGRLLKVGSRHFWDFTDPWTFDYLTEKVINRLKNDGFGYLKVDYNDSIGIGSDHPDSLGEGLRQHLEGVQKFFRKLRADIPDLIIENCSSGGHRLEPSMMELVSMGSFSDAHESPDIPIIAANLHRLILPRQSQVWAVLHASDSLERLHYSLAACFLGRLCLSGEIVQLSDEQFTLVREDLEFYERVSPIIRDGESKIHRAMNRSYRHPKGWQAVVRALRPDSSECLVVLHSFEASAGQNAEIPLPDSGKWQLVEAKSRGVDVQSDETSLRVTIQQDFGAAILHLKTAR